MRGWMNDLVGAAEGIGVLVLLVYAAVKANWELLTLAVILVEVTRIRGVLTGDEYEAFLKSERAKNQPT
jgi:hypothetical protein